MGFGTQTETGEIGVVPELGGDQERGDGRPAREPDLSLIEERTIGTLIRIPTAMPAGVIQSRRAIGRTAARATVGNEDPTRGETRGKPSAAPEGWRSWRGHGGPSPSSGNCG